MLFIEIEKAEAIVKITEPTHLSLQTVFLCFNTGISSQKCIARDFVMQTLWSTHVTNQLSEGFFVFTLPTLRLWVDKKFPMLCLGQFLFFLRGSQPSW